MEEPDFIKPECRRKFAGKLYQEKVNVDILKGDASQNGLKFLEKIWRTKNTGLKFVFSKAIGFKETS